MNLFQTGLSQAFRQAVAGAAKTDEPKYHGFLR
jgi:hypothetical protein